MAKEQQDSEQQDEVKAKTQDEVKADTQDEVKADTQDEVKAKTQDEVKADTQDEVKADTQDEVKAKMQDEVKAEAQDETAENTSDVLVEGGEVINPIAYAVMLRAIHPQASYGRCGYRFNKESAVEIPVENLTGEQVIMLAEDPWLELIPICDK